MFKNISGKELSFHVFSVHEDWKNFEQINENIAQNILLAKEKEAETKGKKVIIPEIKQAYISKFNSICENLVILLIITDGKKIRIVLLLENYQLC